MTLSLGKLSVVLEQLKKTAATQDHIPSASFFDLCRRNGIADKYAIIDAIEYLRANDYVQPIYLGKFLDKIILKQKLLD